MDPDLYPVSFLDRNFKKRIYIYLMTMKSVEDFALHEIEYFERRIIRCRDDVVAARVKWHVVDGLRVLRVVLNELVGSDVPYFERRIGWSGGNKCATRMKCDAVHVARVLVECVHALFCVPVPQLDWLVVRRAHN